VTWGDQILAAFPTSPPPPATSLHRAAAGVSPGTTRETNEDGGGGAFSSGVMVGHGPVPGDEFGLGSRAEAMRTMTNGVTTYVVWRRERRSEVVAACDGKI
jgi:hypothetical protein